MIHYNKVEDFLLDDNFVHLVQSYDRKSLDLFIESHSDKEDLIKQAMLLIRNVRIEPDLAAQEIINEDWEVVKSSISRGKKRRSFFKISTVAAVALVLIVSYIFILQAPRHPSKNNELLSALDSISLNTSEVRIVSGDSYTYVNENDTIKQTNEGSLIVGKDEIDMDNIKEQFLQLIVPNGRRATIKFSDGTFAWINSGSKLMYPKKFAGATRDIYIDGEMYLDVVKDEQHPFVIHTSKFDVKVLGTQFNISAYNKDNSNSVVLVAGKVEVTCSGKKGTLMPEQGFFLEEGKESIKNVDVYKYICWKEGVMVFDAESLSSIIKKLSRYYNVEIHADEKYMSDVYKGKLDLKDSVEDVLKSISLSSPFIVRKENNIIYIK
ncbi:MAG TPA: FecR family protein [Dysgonomonas sp.]|uniref:FecR family protein n=1 Tax=unclassified Dysgonomonas TaxID=2630389 RepID=UPI0025BFEC4E|nr:MULTISPECIES: FecR family protein [unclassified Dysgonomonas]HML66020.1 FecR family protein [Dysgonomonas sp.]